MIVIVSAVAAENALLRHQLEDAQTTPHDDLILTLGRLSGTPVAIVTTGIGKSNTAAATALTITRLKPHLVIMVGCGGAFVGSGLALGDIALASSEIFGDEGVTTVTGFEDMEALNLAVVKTATHQYFNTFPVDLERAQHACRLLSQPDRPQCQLGPFATVSNCSGTNQLATLRERYTHAIIENMEGAACAQICTRMETPFFELRAVSNFVEQRDLSRWNLPLAMNNAQLALLHLFEHGFFTDCPPCTT